MTIVTYAQNFEDIMLWRALKDLPSGFYIDIGANDPYIDSVTKLFYENGWHGINVEPLSHHHEALVESRPRDINVQAAIGNKQGTLDIWEPEVRGWATGSKEVIEQHKKRGVSGKTTRVKQRTLADLCEEHVTGDIHFLKIDVEGLEKAVLEGADFQRFRPWILVIEATEPDSTDENFETWESLVTEAGYKLVYCDGLNRFYLADEKSELSSHFRYPPNIFDDFYAARVPYLENLLSQTEQERDARIEQMRQETERQKERFEKEQKDLVAAIAERDATLSSERAAHESRITDLEWERNTRLAMENSLSWKVSRPLRSIKPFIKSFILPFIKVLLRPIARKGIQFARQHDKVRLFATRILNRFPFIKERVRAFMTHNAMGGPVTHPGYEHTGGYAPLDEPEMRQKSVKGAVNMTETERYFHAQV